MSVRWIGDPAALDLAVDATERQCFNPESGHEIVAGARPVKIERRRLRFVDSFGPEFVEVFWDIRCEQVFLVAQLKQPATTGTLRPTVARHPRACRSSSTMRSPAGFLR